MTLSEAIAVWRVTAARLAFGGPPNSIVEVDAFVAACGELADEAERRRRIDLRGHVTQFKEDVLRCFRDKLPVNPALTFGEADDAANQLEKLSAVNPAPQQPATAAPSNATKIDKALALLIAHPEWTVKQIAEAAGCNPKYLSSKNAKVFRAARQAQRATLPKGRKGRDGEIEAWEND